MKRPTDLQIKVRIAEIDADDRYHYPPADGQVNWPLAIIQVAMDAEARALAWALGVAPPKSGPKGKK